MTLGTKIGLCILYLFFCYPVVPGLFRIYEGESFAGIGWSSKFIVAYNIIFGGIYFYLMSYTLCTMSMKFNLFRVTKAVGVGSK